MATYDVRYNPDWPNAVELIDIAVGLDSLEAAIGLLREKVMYTYPYAIDQEGDGSRFQVPSRMIGQAPRDARGATLILGLIFEHLTAKDKKIREFESLLEEIKETRKKLRRLAKSRVKMSYEIEAMNDEEGSK